MKDIDIGTYEKITLCARNGFIEDERVDRVGIRNKLLLRRHPRRHLRHVFHDIVQVYTCSLSITFLVSGSFVYWK